MNKQGDINNEDVDKIKRRKLCLIHGSMMAVPSPFKHNSVVVEQRIHGGFESFRNEIENGRVDLFRWFDEYDPSFKSDILSPLKAYYSDRERVKNEKLQLKLFTHLQLTMPTVIATHSKGCELILNTFKNYGLVGSIKYIIFIQSDADNVIDLKELADKFSVINIFAKDDLTLWSSVILNRGVGRHGLNAINLNNVENIEYTSFGNHNASMNDLEIKEFIMHLL